MNRFVINTCVFPPEPIVSAKTSYSLAVNLTQQKNAVRVITNFPNRPSGKMYAGYKRSLYKTENHADGFTLTRCFTFLSRESSIFSRWLENISFGLTSSLALLFSPRPDAVYSNTWPIFATALTTMASKVRKIPLVIHVKDLYPESLVIQERLKPDQWFYKFLLWIDKWIADQADELIVLSENFARGYTQVRQIDPAKVHVIPDWVDQNSIVLLDKNVYRKEAGISPDAFVIGYGGNIGKAAGVEIIIEAISRIKTEKEMVLIIAGSGTQLSICQKLAEGITNARILFHSPWAPDETSKVLAAADTLFLPTQGTQSIVSVPSKLLSYLLASKPVLAVVLPESDTAQVIEDADCGWIVPPDNLDLLVQKIEEAASLPAKALEEMGLAGREYALKNFATETTLPKVIQIIERAVRKKKR